MNDNFVGNKFGKLTVIQKSASPNPKYTVWQCKCECGAIKDFVKHHLTSGHTKSCGCGKRFTKVEHHGKYFTREYRTWAGMKCRCENPNQPCFKYYGGSGITVCKGWRNSFLTFLRDMGSCPDGMEIDRIDNTLGYFPGNCRWTDHKTNMQNRRRSHKESAR